MADTTKVNVGRRRMPPCQAIFCRRRVDAKGDEFCRVCLQAPRPPARKPSPEKGTGRG